jgi:hypothetical protein
MANAATGMIIRIALNFLVNVRRRGATATAPTPAGQHLRPGDIPPEQPHYEYRPDGSRVLVLPEQTIYGGNGPSRAGTPFPGPDQAAAAGLKEIYGRSMDSGHEYAGQIYRNPDGTYSFSPPVTDRDPDNSTPSKSPVPPGATVVGTYHSHGAGTVAGYETDELFSPTDKVKATFSHQPSYLLTPRGNLFKYTPVDMLPLADRARFPTGRVSQIH